MIKVDQKETLRRFYFIKRHSIRQIAEEFHRSRKTVRKAMADASVPHYRLAAPKPSPVMGPYLDKVREWLEADKSRPGKQRHTAHRIYERLISECGFTGAERTVREHVSKLRPRLAALLAERGFKGPQGALDKKEWGFWASISDRCNWRILASQLGEEFYLKKNLTEDSLCPPMTQKELEAKFGSLARRVISDKQVMKIIDIINCLEELSDVRELAPTFCQTRMGKPEI